MDENELCESTMNQLSVEDKFTMEFLVNKKFFKRCLDAENYESSRQKVDTLIRMKTKIMELTSELLDDFISSSTLTKSSVKMCDIFSAYTDVCIECIEAKVMEENAEDDDTLFDFDKKSPAIVDNTLTRDKKLPTIVDNTLTRVNSSSSSHSFWGKQIKKTN